MSITDQPRQLQLPTIESPSTRPQCVKCQAYGPTINGRCSEHLTLADEAAKYCCSPEDLEAFGLL